MPPPAILLAFANNWVDERRHLRSLLEESKSISAALTPLVQSGALALPTVHNATAEEVIETFRARPYRNRIRVFHFGGHASSSTLIFEDQDGAPSEAHASGLAAYLGQQQRLVLVFLNGCSTEAQIRRLRAAGVKAVVATTASIDDRVAAKLAAAFYAELATRSLRDAFEAAVSAVRALWGDDPRAVTRDVEVPEVHGAPSWPWIFDCDPAYEAWTLASEMAPDHTWRNRILFAGAAMSLLLLTSLIVSAEARRTACRAPGLRSLCAAVGLSTVPTDAEQALWDGAHVQTSGDGLRAYLRAYPTGVYSDEARARLAGCRTERVETLGPKREARYVLPVNPVRARPWPTESEARRDAQQRGDRDAATACEPLRLTARLLSVKAEPHDWKCSHEGSGIACGFDGEIVCQVQDQLQSDRENCRDHGE